MAQNAFGLSQEKRKEYGLDIIYACILCYAGLGSDGSKTEKNLREFFAGYLPGFGVGSEIGGQ